jgi:predicted double-glycine peptidase
MRFRDWLLSEEAIPAGAIKIDLPSVRQQKNYTCGTAALRAIAELHGVGPEKEVHFEKLLKSNRDVGTSPKNIVKIGKALGLNPESKADMSIKELISHLGQKRPVVCAMQAWGEPKDYKKAGSGHYVVAIGYTDDRIYFEDPSLKGSRGYLKHQEFDERWHDIEANGKHYYHLGIVFLSSPEKPKEEVPHKAKKIQ